MPVYMYKCHNCGFSKKIIQNKPEQMLWCEKCATQMKRDYTAENSNFILKGDKWASKKGY